MAVYPIAARWVFETTLHIFLIINETFNISNPFFVFQAKTQIMYTDSFHNRTRAIFYIGETVFGSENLIL